MKIFLWDESLVVGNAKIDAEHKEILNALRELQLALYSQVSLEEIKLKFTQIDKYRKEHFVTEEKLMLPYKDELSSYKEHLEHHRFFSHSMDEFFIKFSEHGTLMAEELYDFLGNWFHSHVSKMDMQTFKELKALNAPYFDGD